MKVRSCALAGGAVAVLVATVAVAGPATSAPAPAPAPAAGVAPSRTASTSVAARADRADSLAAARRARVESGNRWLRETLPSGDVDWFHYRVVGSRAVSVTLGGLPADYDLAVFTADGRQLASSTRKRRTFDEVWLRNPADDLFVRVVRKRGAAAGTYSLRLREITQSFQLLSAHKATTRGVVFGEFYNATPEWLAVTELDVEWLDRRGRVLKRLETYMDPAAWVRPWSKFPFTAGDQISGALDGRATRVRAEVKVTLQDTPIKEAPLKARITKIISWKKTATYPGRRTYWGTVTNGSSRRVRPVGVYVCDYNAYGTLTVLSLAWPGYAVAAHGRTTWGDTDDNGTGDWSKPSLRTVRAYEHLGG